MQSNSERANRISLNRSFPLPTIEPELPEEHVYYSDWEIGPKKNTVSVGVQARPSADQITSWTVESQAGISQLIAPHDSSETIDLTFLQFSDESMYLVIMV